MPYKDGAMYSEFSVIPAGSGIGIDTGLFFTFPEKVRR